MKRILSAALCAAFLVSAAFAAPAATYRHDGAAVLPNAKTTPGATDSALTKTKLCDPSFHTISARHVTESEKKLACSAYGITAGCPGKGYEIDHLISIEIGGSNDQSNLWPQPVDTSGVIGFHTKDVVENRLHRLICSGDMTLARAQSCIAGDWYACAQRLKILPGASK